MFLLVFSILLLLFLVVHGYILNNALKRLNDTVIILKKVLNILNVPVSLLNSAALNNPNVTVSVRNTLNAFKKFFQFDDYNLVTIA